MTITDPFNRLTLTARMIRSGAHDREERIRELFDAAEFSGDRASYSEACWDALDDTQDDLWQLIEQVEDLTFDRLPERSPRINPAALGDDVAGDDVAVGIEAWGDTIERAPDPAGTTASIDMGERLAPQQAIDSIQGSVPRLMRDAVGRVPLPTLMVRMSRQTDEFRRIFDAKPGQLVLETSSEGDRLATLHSIGLYLFDDELVDDGGTFVSLAIDTGDDPDDVHVVSGWAVAIIDADHETSIEFDDGTSVPYYDITAIKFG